MSQVRNSHLRPLEKRKLIRPALNFCFCFTFTPRLDTHDNGFIGPGHLFFPPPSQSLFPPLRGGVSQGVTGPVSFPIALFPRRALLLGTPFDRQTGIGEELRGERERRTNSVRHCKERVSSGVAVHHVTFSLRLSCRSRVIYPPVLIKYKDILVEI